LFFSLFFLPEIKKKVFRKSLLMSENDKSEKPKEKNTTKEKIVKKEKEKGKGKEKEKEKDDHKMVNKKMALIGMIVFIVLYSVIIFYARRRQRATFFRPDDEQISDIPEDFVAGNYKNIRYWYMDKFPNRPVILFFHGSTGNISYHDPMVHFAKKYEFNLFLTSYRGYYPVKPTGETKDKVLTKSVVNNFQPTEESFYEDADNAYEFLTVSKKISPSLVVVWGVSLGCLAGSYLAGKNNGKDKTAAASAEKKEITTPKESKETKETNLPPTIKKAVETGKIGKLILWSTFASPSAIFDSYEGKELTRMDKLLYYSVKPFLHKMHIEKNLSQVMTPTIILHSRTDEVIGYENAVINYKKLSKNLDSSKLKLLEIGGLHSKPVLTAEMWHQLLDFLNTNF
jgi:esterase/lipase